MDEKESKSPFILEIVLSEDAYVVQSLSTYSLTDFLIAIGGLSKSFYIIGLISARFVAKMLYKKNLI